MTELLLNVVTTDFVSRLNEVVRTAIDTDVRLVARLTQTVNGLELRLREGVPRHSGFLIVRADEVRPAATSSAYPTYRADTEALTTRQTQPPDR